MNLLLAIHAEHKQRTGHDVFNEPPLSTKAICCDVCLYLKAEKQALDKAAKDHRENHRRFNTVTGQFESSEPWVLPKLDQSQSQRT